MSFLLAEDAALKSYIAGTGIYAGTGLKVADEKNASRDVQVWFGFPDVEIRTQQFPFITIEVIDIRPGNDRQTWGYIKDTTFQGTIAPVGSGSATKLYTYDMPVAYDIEYQISTYARHPRHDRAIIQQMLKKFPSKFGYLNVPTELGDARYRHLFLESFIKRDSVDQDSGSKRLLRNIYTVRLVSEMTPSDAEKAAAVAVLPVATATINSTTTYIPNGFQPV